MAIGIFTILAGLVALAGAYLYFFGVSAETKRKLENQALKTMGENKMSYTLQNQINNIPTSDQENLAQLKKGISNLAGGASQNPLGEQAVRAANQTWELAQKLARTASEKIDWKKVQDTSEATRERVLTSTNKAAEQVEGTVKKTVDEAAKTAE